MRFFEFELILPMTRSNAAFHLIMNGKSILRGIYLRNTPLLEKVCIYTPMKMVLPVITKPENVIDITICRKRKLGCTSK